MTRVWQGGMATEEGVKTLHGPELLHVSTHAFFLPNATPSDARTQLDRALTRSGLALAGANRQTESAKDGILTALELAGVDLWGTKLVNLSACETGVGEHVGGEGIYGLRRALVLAGSETQVVSLWRVEANASRCLMTEYYRRLRAGEGRSEAMRQTQLALLADPDTAHPYYWAAFVVQGDPRSLDGGAASAVTPVRIQPGPRGCSCSVVGGGRDAPEPWIVLLMALFAMAATERGHRARD
jgi:MYXO-CTERM domain-containing protein